MIPFPLYDPGQYAFSKADTSPIRIGDSIFLQQNLTAVFGLWGPVPRDKLLLVLTTSVATAAGAAQNTSMIECLIVGSEAGNPVQEAIWQHRNPTASGTLAMQGENPFIVLPDELLMLRGQFSAAANANEARLGFQGILIPRGNFQFGSLPRSTS